MALGNSPDYGSIGGVGGAWRHWCHAERVERGKWEKGENLSRERSLSEDSVLSMEGTCAFHPHPLHGEGTVDRVGAEDGVIKGQEGGQTENGAPRGSACDFGLGRLKRGRKSSVAPKSDAILARVAQERVGG